MALLMFFCDSENLQEFGWSKQNVAFEDSTTMLQFGPFDPIDLLLNFSWIECSAIGSWHRWVLQRPKTISVQENKI
jgi:hypothetical protein